MAIILLFRSVWVLLSIVDYFYSKLISICVFPYVFLAREWAYEVGEVRGLCEPSSQMSKERMRCSFVMLRFHLFPGLVWSAVALCFATEPLRSSHLQLWQWARSAMLRTGFPKVQRCSKMVPGNGKLDQLPSRTQCSCDCPLPRSPRAWGSQSLTCQCHLVRLFHELDWATVAWGSFTTPSAWGDNVYGSDVQKVVDPFQN